VSTFVLVHGAWGGGWEWRDVADLLISRGHRAFTPTLAGLGERSHLLTRSVSLETHVTDVVQLIEWERLDDVVLTGHSYAGMVISVAAPRVAQRLQALVYVDAFVPSDGECELDLIEPAWAEEMILEPSRSAGQGWLVPFPFGDDLDEYPAEAAARYRGSMHPLATFTDPVRDDDRAAQVPTAFVHCTRKEAGSDAFLGSERRARERGWTIREIDSGHDVQLEDPAGIANALEELATP
jgi:pimeloyl-ACP methyl ester carboxylesterase